MQFALWSNVFEMGRLVINEGRVKDEVPATEPKVAARSERLQRDSFVRRQHLGDTRGGV